MRTVVYMLPPHIGIRVVRQSHQCSYWAILLSSLKFSEPDINDAAIFGHFLSNSPNLTSMQLYILGHSFLKFSEPDRTC